MSKLTKALTAAAGNAGESLYVEDVFSNYLWAGNSTAGRVIVNDIDVSGEGGLVWIKDRTGINGNADSHSLFTTTQGANKTLLTNTTGAEDTVGTDVFQAFNSNGFTVGSHGRTNENNRDYVSWTFRKAEKFFDIVTYTGNGSDQDISHNLGSTPGFVIIKATSTTGNWSCWHSALNASSRNYIVLNSTSRDGGSTVRDVNSSTFEIYGNYPDEGSNGVSYVAYVFASDAGGFGDDGSENIIKCGSYTGTSSLNSISCGFEPQFVLVKCSSHNNTRWSLFDAMRGVATGASATTGDDQRLAANSSDAESAFPMINFTATGFDVQNQYADVNENSRTYIYIAIRRPMKTPTAGTEVFAMDTGTTSIPNWISNFVTDFVWYKDIDSVYSNYWQSRLTGSTWLKTDSTDAQSSGSEAVWDFMDGFGAWSTVNNVEAWMFKRATGFMDVVGYSGNSVAGRAVAHNLGVVPELMLVKRRNQGGGQGWNVYAASLGNTSFITLNTNQSAFTGQPVWNSTTPTSSVFYLSDDAEVNNSSYTYISYLFATLAGVSKVGSYTGTGSNVDVDCGFSAGARFILIKRTDSTGDWYVWDSARGIVAGNDPYLLLNSSAAQVTNTDYVDPLSSGFTVTSSAPAALNASGGNYIFLAIA